MTGVRRPAALVLAALALAAAPAPAFAFTPGAADAPGAVDAPGAAPAPVRDFGAAAGCLQEVAAVPALGSHGAGPTHCAADGTVLDHAVGILGSLTR
ncbi:hypothetical protein ACFVFS_36300 [Kitasatospora sp. NPDC057692]|uniref:hypothetical protein n=1 Tax=Kitasatospora sp. NPDC057692 TaxID=3346215 RepID=UPI0036CF243D